VSRFRLITAACLLMLSGRAPAGEIWTNPLGMKFVRIPAGEFVMGSPVTERERANNEVQHLVKITKAFWLSQTDVTVGQFATFANDTGYKTAAEKEGWANGAWNLEEKKWNRIDGASWKTPGFAQDTNHPVVDVDWRDAQAFCQWLSKKEGRKYRLPTEAEWEYACRARTKTAYPWGDNPDDSRGWLNGTDDLSTNLFHLFTPFKGSDGYVYTSPVAAFKPNAWGLYDMLGNVLQWCSDWYGDYPTNAVSDPQGVTAGKEHILRGGSFVYGIKHCRSAFRGRNKPEFRNFYVGFRVLRED